MTSKRRRRSSGRTTCAPTASRTRQSTRCGNLRRVRPGCNPVRSRLQPRAPRLQPRALQAATLCAPAAQPRPSSHPRPPQVVGELALLVTEHVRDMTVPMPEAQRDKNIRKCWNPEADGMTKLRAHYNKTHPDHQVSMDVYARIADELCAEEEIDNIVPRSYDHNICAVCERRLTAMHGVLERMRVNKSGKREGAMRPATASHPLQPSRPRPAYYTPPLPPARRLGGRASRATGGARRVQGGPRPPPEEPHQLQQAHPRDRGGDARRRCAAPHKAAPLGHATAPARRQHSAPAARQQRASARHSPAAPPPAQRVSSAPARRASSMPPPQ